MVPWTERCVAVADKCFLRCLILASLLMGVGKSWARSVSAATVALLGVLSGWISQARATGQPIRISQKASRFHSSEAAMHDRTG